MAATLHTDRLLTFLASCIDRKSTRLNSSHVSISYAVFCLKKNSSLPATCSAASNSNRCSSSYTKFLFNRFYKVVQFKNGHVIDSFNNIFISHYLLPPISC